MDISLTKSEFQELLATLYLRLNGYFTSGFIVHAPEDNCTQIDILAVRFPLNAEPEREVEPSPWLQIPPFHIDILMCEVKGQDEKLQFNSPVRKKKEAIQSVLRWIGNIDEKYLDQTVISFQKVIATQPIQTPDYYSGITNHDIPVIETPLFSLRGVLFAPDREAPLPNQPRFVYGQEIIDFSWKCFCPDKPRKQCATRYDFNLWGIYQPIVRYFKDRKQSGKNQGTMQNVYDHFGF
jgi:hypothetical protein